MTRAPLLALAALLAACAEPYPTTIYLAPADPELAALALAADARWEAAGVVDHIAAAGALMREDSGGWQITEADLEAVCAAGECTGWTPEVAP